MKRLGKDWFVALKDGDQRAFSQIFHEKKEPIYLYCYDLLKDSFEAENVTANVFYKLYGNLAQIETPKHLVAWLYFVARVECLNILRSKKRSPASLPLPEEIVADHEGGLDFEQARAVLIARINREIETLPSPIKEMFRRRYIGGDSCDKIASEFDIDLDTVYTKLENARKKLRRRLSYLHFEAIALLYLILIYILL